MAPLVTTLPHAAALIRACDARISELFGVKAARIYGFGVAATFGISMLILGERAERHELQRLLFSALTTLSWIAGGMAGLAAAGDLAARDSADGIDVLVRQRGHGERALEQARVLAVSLRVARLIALPGLAVALIALLQTRSLAALPWNLYLCAVPLVYGLLLGAGVALFARGAARLLPAHGRALFALLVLGPELSRHVFSEVPSLPAVYGGLLDALDGWGTRLP